MSVCRFSGLNQKLHLTSKYPLYIVGSSLACDPFKNYGIDYTIVLKDANENIVGGNHYRLSNTGCPAKDLIDVKRFALHEGKYSIEVELNDILDSINVISIQQKTEIEPEGAQSKLSDIQLLSTIHSELEGTSPFQKSGLYLEPLPFRYYYPALDFLNLYIESYQADQLEGQPYLRYTIKPTSGEIPSPIVAYRKVKKENIGANVFQLDITQLISGPYLVEAALFDGNKVEVASKNIDFSRYNPAR